MFHIIIFVSAGISVSRSTLRFSSSRSAFSYHITSPVRLLKPAFRQRGKVLVRYLPQKIIRFWRCAAQGKYFVFGRELYFGGVYWRWRGVDFGPAHSDVAIIPGVLKVMLFELLDLTFEFSEFDLHFEFFFEHTLVVGVVFVGGKFHTPSVNIS